MTNATLLSVHLQVLPLVVQSLPTLGQRATYVRAFLWAMPGALGMLCVLCCRELPCPCNAACADGAPSLPAACSSLLCRPGCYLPHLSMLSQPSLPMLPPCRRALPAVWHHAGARHGPGELARAIACKAGRPCAAAAAAAAGVAPDFACLWGAWFCAPVAECRVQPSPLQLISRPCYVSVRGPSCDPVVALLCASPPLPGKQVGWYRLRHVVPDIIPRGEAGWKVRLEQMRYSQLC